MNQIILNDGSVIEADSITLEPHFTVKAADKAAFLSVWDSLTPENLQHIQLVVNDSIAANYENCELIGTQTIGSDPLTCHFYMTGTPIPSVDPVYEEAYKILTGEANGQRH